MKDIIQGRERIWSLQYEPGDPARDAAIDALVADLHISPVMARLLYNRGHHTAASAATFMACDARSWHDPFLMKDMEIAVTRTLGAVADREKIAIYGDYDVDGVTSVTSLYLYLTGLGADVTCYIPNRLGEGYGMSRQGIDQLAAKGVTLIITVDTGVTAHEEVIYAADKGMDTVVTDHHECHNDLPLCMAVVNPHRPDCSYPFKELAGVGVVFKFLCACETLRRATAEGVDRAAVAAAACEAVSRAFIDLVAIGTIADVMPLTDENRYIVSRGLSMLDHTDRPGLDALLEAISGGNNKRPVTGAAAKPRRKVNASLVGFGIAPRINAAGRIAHAMQAVELLLSTDPDRAQTMAAELCEINAHRQTEENHIAEQAYSMIENQLTEAKAAGKPAPRIIVLEDDGWMQGIVGIVASRITEKYGLPSILISFDGAISGDPSPMDIGKGSGRSVKGMNLVDALADSEELLVRYGGHELAAGLTIRRADIPAFRERINAYATAHLTDDMTAVRYEADCEVTVDELTMELAEEIDGMEPFGVSNPTPLFQLCDVTVQRIIPLGGGKHTKLVLYADGVMLQAVWFGMATATLPITAGAAADVLFQLNINEYQGVRSLQMILQDLRPSRRYTDTCRREADHYAHIMEGGAIRPDEDVVPTREDIVQVYTQLRGDARLGYDTFVDRHLLGRINAGAEAPMGYVKLRLILHILHELAVCHIQPTGLPEEGSFAFEINFSAPKTCVDSSPLLCRLRRQIGAGE